MLHRYSSSQIHTPVSIFVAPIVRPPPLFIPYPLHEFYTAATVTIVTPAADRNRRNFSSSRLARRFIHTAKAMSSRTVITESGTLVEGREIMTEFRRQHCTRLHYTHITQHLKFKSPSNWFLVLYMVYPTP